MGEDKWVKCSERMPGEDLWTSYVKVYDEETGTISIVHALTTTDVREWHITYWQPVELPDPPKPEPVYECPHCHTTQVCGMQVPVRTYRGEFVDYGGWFYAWCSRCKAQGPIEQLEMDAMAHFRKEG